MKSQHSSPQESPKNNGLQRPPRREPQSRKHRLGAFAGVGAAGLALAIGCSYLPEHHTVNGRASAQTGATAQAQSLSQAFTQVAEGVSPAVVSIKVEAKAESPHGFFFGGGAGPQSSVRGGSGFIFRSDGAILTNNHVVENADRVEVKLQDGRIFEAKVLGTDPATDLAVLKIDAKGLNAVQFADSDKARVGEWVVAIGSPFGLDYTLTVGVLSAKGRGIGANEIEDYLQTDASINPGNSGGPLLNLDGQVLGVNTVIVGPRNAGVGFAIPSNLVRHVGEQLLKSGEVSRAWIGVGFQELTPDLAKSFGTKVQGGALVSHVEPGGPAAKAGIKPGDVIEKVGDQPVNQGRDLLRAVLNKRVGEQTQLTLLRGGKRVGVTLTTGERPGSETLASGGQGGGKGAVTDGFGLSVQTLTPELAQRLGYEGEGKVVIRGVAPGSPAARAGLTQGDVIVEADKSPVRSTSDLSAALKDGQALLRVDRRGGSLFIALKK